MKLGERIERRVAVGPAQKKTEWRKVVGAPAPPALWLAQTKRNERLVELIARAFAAGDRLISMDDVAIAAMPVTRLRHLRRMARLAWLNPSIVRAILAGTQPAHLGARSFWRMAELPLHWAAQRAALGFPAN